MIIYLRPKPNKNVEIEFQVSRDEKISQRNLSSEDKKLHKVAENLAAVIKLLKVEKLCKCLRLDGGGSARDNDAAGFVYFDSEYFATLLSCATSSSPQSVAILRSIKLQIFKVFVIGQLLWLRKD